MTILKAKIPDFLFRQAEAIAAKEEISIDQVVALALSAQLSAWYTEDYLETRAKRGSWEKLQQVLAKVPHVQPEEYDRLPEAGG